MADAPHPEPPQKPPKLKIDSNRPLLWAGGIASTIVALVALVFGGRGSREVAKSAAAPATDPGTQPAELVLDARRSVGERQQLKTSPEPSNTASATSAATENAPYVIEITPDEFRAVFTRTSAHPLDRDFSYTLLRDVGKYRSQDMHSWNFVELGDDGNPYLFIGSLGKDGKPNTIEVTPIVDLNPHDPSLLYPFPRKTVSYKVRFQQGNLNAPLPPPMLTYPDIDTFEAEAELYIPAPFIGRQGETLITLQRSPNEKGDERVYGVNALDKDIWVKFVAPEELDILGDFLPLIGKALKVVPADLRVEPDEMRVGVKGLQDYFHLLDIANPNAPHHAAALKYEVERQTLFSPDSVFPRLNDEPDAAYIDRILAEDLTIREKILERLVALWQSRHGKRAKKELLDEIPQEQAQPGSRVVPPVQVEEARQATRGPR